MTTPPTEYVVIRRRYKHAPHDAVMYDAIVNERQQWLVLSPGELAPEVADAHRPDLVVLRPWLDPRITAVEVRLENIGRGGGSWVNAFAYAIQEELPPEERRPIRHRLGEVFGAELRTWVDYM
jgi:hypothetical protein